MWWLCFSTSQVFYTKQQKTTTPFKAHGNKSSLGRAFHFPRASLTQWEKRQPFSFPIHFAELSEIAHHFIDFKRFLWRTAQPNPNCMKWNLQIKFWTRNRKEILRYYWLGLGFWGVFFTHKSQQKIICKLNRSASWGKFYFPSYGKNYTFVDFKEPTLQLVTGSNYPSTDKAYKGRWGQWSICSDLH